MAIYSFAETGRDTEAGKLVLVSAAIAFVALARIGAQIERHGVPFSRGAGVCGGAVLQRREVSRRGPHVHPPADEAQPQVL